MDEIPITIFLAGIFCGKSTVIMIVNVPEANEVSVPSLDQSNL